MPDNYILYPSTRRGLAAELKRALDAYAAGQIGNADLEALVRAWVKNCDFLCEDGHVAPGVAGYLGKRRCFVLEKLLKSME